MSFSPANSALLQYGMTFRTRLRFIFMMAGRHLITNSWDFPDDRSRFCYDQLRFSWWPLRKKCPYSELLWSVFFGIRTEYGPEWKTPNAGTFHAVDRSRLLWPVEIFMTGQNFHDDRSRFQDCFNRDCNWGCLVSTLFSVVKFLTQLNRVSFFQFIFKITILKMRNLYSRCCSYIIKRSLTGSW